MSTPDVNGITVVPVDGGAVAGIDVGHGLPTGPAVSVDIPAMGFGGFSTPEVHVGGAVGDVLPFTGTGPGTLPLVILGVISIVVGAWCALWGRRAPVRQRDDRWPDLSDRAHSFALTSAPREH